MNHSRLIYIVNWELEFFIKKKRVIKTCFAYEFVFYTTAYQLLFNMLGQRWSSQQQTYTNRDACWCHWLERPVLGAVRPHAGMWRCRAFQRASGPSSISSMSLVLQICVSHYVKLLGWPIQNWNLPWYGGLTTPVLFTRAIIGAWMKAAPMSIQGL